MPCKYPFTSSQDQELGLGLVSSAPKTACLFSPGATHSDPFYPTIACILLNLPFLAKTSPLHKSFWTSFFTELNKLQLSIREGILSVSAYPTKGQVGPLLVTLS